MARPRRTSCRVCGGHVDIVGPLSARGKCKSCATRRMIENMDALHVHDGLWFDRWRANLLAAFGVTVEPTEPKGRE